MMTLVYKGLRDVISDGRDTVECGAAGSPRRCIVNHHHHSYRNHINGWMITFGPMVRGLYITVIVTMIT